MDSKFSDILGEIFDDFKGLIKLGIIIVIIIILLYFFGNWVNSICPPSASSGGYC